MSSIKFETIVGGPIGTNCYIVYNGETKEAIIIDPGIEAEKIIKFISGNGLNPVAVFLTHGHFDHMMSCAQIAANYRVKTYIHEAEAELLSDGNMNCSFAMFGKAYGMKAQVLLKDNQTVELIGTAIKVLHTPGHTKGGCCYYFEDDKLLFCGDTLFMQSVGRTDLPTGSAGELIRSLNEKILVLPEDVKAFPGHGPATSIGYEKRNNPYADGLF